MTELNNAIAIADPDKVFILTDSNVAKIEESLISELCNEYNASLIVTPAGEVNKSWSALEKILMHLSRERASRRSLLICIGGGMTTDIGGFAAAIFKRGIRHINIATTLLAAVDAAVGGKTGIDFNGLKNEVGAFRLPLLTLFDPSAFATLPQSEILSGFGEVVKTALIADQEMTRRILASDPLDMSEPQLAEICRFCRDEKMRIVSADPTEKGLRKVLNFGHTAGHPFESLSIEKGVPLPHGVAIAHGNLVSLILSMDLLGLVSEWISCYARWLRTFYPPLSISCADYTRLWELATHDKKNLSSSILSYTLVNPIGKPRYDCPVNFEQFRNSLDLYQELQGR